MDRNSNGKLKVFDHGKLYRSVSNSLSTLETIIADFGDNLSPNSAATIVASVDRA